MDKIQKRNEHGLYDHINYVYREDGLGIDWKKMLKPEHLAFNAQYESKIKQIYKVDDLSQLDKSTVEDKYLVILLSGIKYLARLRGYLNVDNVITHTSDQKATANCSIVWTPNIETNGVEVAFSDSASASTMNTQGFGSMYLESIAANRAFVRAVRNFLEINIVGFDELKGDKEAPETTSSNSPNPVALLKDVLKKAGVTTVAELKKSEKLKDKDDKFGIHPKDWTTLDALDTADIFELISIFKR